VHEAFQKVGEPTEAAMKVACEKIGTEDMAFNKTIPYVTKAEIAVMTSTEKVVRASQVDDRISSLYTRLATLEFNRDRKSMAVIVERKGNSGYFTRKASEARKILYVKGAPEDILERCTFVRTNSAYDKPTSMTAALKEVIMQKVSLWGEGESLRVLALATG
jgi:P-type Ca2+ transporter type 2A